MTKEQLDAGVEAVLNQVCGGLGLVPAGLDDYLRKAIHARLDPLVTATDPDYVERFAKVEWSVGDMTDVYDVTEADAETFLGNHARKLQDVMTERGWDAIDTWASAAGYKRLDQIEDGEE